MTERLQSASTAGQQCPKMETDLSPRKTMVVLVIVVGCFAVLWPKVFYPMIVGSANQHIKPSPIDKTTGCCDVISETDVNIIKIMSELCGTIIKATEEKPLSGKEIVQKCRQEILETCGIDISVVLQEQVRLGQNVKQILDEIRSLNGSLCLKYNYGFAPWKLGVRHTITVKTAAEASNIRQERPLHLRSELVHPAFRERGRAIPKPQEAPPTKPPPRVVEGRPGPIPGMRPTIGGAGHVVPPSKQGTSNMSVIMPIYTIGIVIFFTYTLMKIIFKKQPPDQVGGAVYSPVEPDPHFRKEVFESEASRLGPRLTRENIASKLVVNAMSALLDEVDQEMEARRKSSEVASQDLVNGTLSNGDAVKPHDEEQPTVKVLGMEMTASCEGGKKWSRPESPVLPASPPPPAHVEPVPPPQEIFLEGALPAQSHLLVAESATESESTTGEDPAVVLSGKMTLSVISLDSENGSGEATNGTEGVTLEHHSIIKAVEEALEESEIPPQISAKIEEKPLDSNIAQNNDKLEKTEDPVATTIQESTAQFIEEILREENVALTLEKPTFDIENETEKILANLGDENSHPSALEQDIQNFLEKLKEDSGFQAPVITLESEDVPHTLEVESLEREVEDLIQEAIESIQQKEPSVEILPVEEPSNEIQIETTTIEKEPETKQQTFLQVSNDALDLESEKSAKLELKEDISNEIEKLIQEVKDLPVIQQKFKDNELDKKEPTHEKNRTPSDESNQIIEKLSLETEKLDAAVDKISHKIEEITSNIEEMEEPVAKTETKLVAAVPQLADLAKIVDLQTKTKISDESKTKIEEKQKSDEEPQKLESKSTNEAVGSIVVEEPKVEKVETSAAAAKPSSNVEVVAQKPKQDLTVSNTVEEKSRSSESDDEELGSDEELVEEIEEIVYEEESGEEEEIEVEITDDEEEEESEEELPLDRNTNRTESSSVQRVNGTRSDDPVEESKYTTVSGATAAENDISDEELIDDEEVEEEEEEEEIIEVEEMEDEEYVNEGNDVNHLSGDSDAEL